MKALLSAVAVLLTTTTAWGDEPQVAMEPLGELRVAPGELVFPVKEREVAVDGELIRRFAIGRKVVTATYFNKSQDKKRPRYGIELYNRFGLLLGEHSTGTSDFSFGGPGYIEAEDVGTEVLHVEWYPLDRILAKSAMKLPAEWQAVKWVVIKDNNPRTLKR